MRIGIGADAEFQYFAHRFGRAFELEAGHIVDRGFVAATVDALDPHFKRVFLFHGEADGAKVDAFGGKSA